MKGRELFWFRVVVILNGIGALWNLVRSWLR